MKPNASGPHYMELALEQAELGIGTTHPNPRVGAVVVKDGKVVGSGYHRYPGGPHAEINALEAAGRKAQGAEMFVTLEPHDHQGRTPPCTEAIIRAGIRRVFAAVLDPNPKVRGRGVARLNREGVKVSVGMLEDQAEKLNRPYFKFMRTGLPWMTLKAAISLDGKIATAQGDSKWITGSTARGWVHALRNQVDAVLVGANTVRRDNPRLTTRLSREPELKLKQPLTHSPARVVVNSWLDLPLSRKIFSGSRSTAGSTPVRRIVATLESTRTETSLSFAKKGVEVWTCPSSQGKVNLENLLQKLASEGMLHVMVEGGAELFNSLLRKGLFDELFLLVAPKIIGREGVSWAGGLGISKMSQSLSMTLQSVQTLDTDVLIHALKN